MPLLGKRRAGCALARMRGFCNNSAASSMVPTEVAVKAILGGGSQSLTFSIRDSAGICLGDPDHAGERCPDSALSPTKERAAMRSVALAADMSAHFRQRILQYGSASEKSSPVAR